MAEKVTIQTELTAKEAAPREVQRLRMTGLPEYQPIDPFTDSDSQYVEIHVAQSALADIVNAAVSVGRGTETVKNLNMMLEPYGIRRKA